MRITKLWKWSGSDAGDCPALYELDQVPARFKGETRAYGVVGLVADDAVHAEIDELGPGEVLVAVPPEVIERIVTRLSDEEIATIRA
jgi:hypothetical protein